MHGSSRLPAGFRSRLSRGWWLSPSCSSRFCRFGRDRFSRFAHGRLSGFGWGWLSGFGWGWLSHFGRSRLPGFSYSGLFRFDHDFNRSRQFRLGRFPRAVVALVQQLDAVGFLVRAQLSFFMASALVLEVFRNRFRCHDRSVAELSSSKLSNCDHSMTTSRLARAICRLRSCEKAIIWILIPRPPAPAITTSTCGAQRNASRS